MLPHNLNVIFFIIGLATFEQGQTATDQPKTTFQTINSTETKISLNYCCRGGKFYKPFLDTCPFWDPADNSSEPQLENLPVYSANTNQIIKVSHRIELTSGSVTDCPDGYFGNSTRKFKLFDDGSLRIDEKRLEPKSFCINSIQDTSNLTFVARFCDPDPCRVNGTKCIRKCCPLGMAMNYGTKTCDPYPIPFSASELRNEDKTPISLASFTVYGGLGLKCLNLGVGINIVNPKDFVILADGRMKNLDYPCIALELDERTTENYCVDHLFTGNQTVGFKFWN